MSSRDLIGYAVLRANYDAHRGSYIDNFKEFTLFALNKCPGSGSEGEVAKYIEDFFGLAIPDAVVGKLLKRGVMDKTVRRVEDKPARYAIAKSFDSADLESKVTQFKREQSELVAALSAYVAEHHEVHLPLLDDPAGQLTSYIERNAGAVLSQVIRGKGASEPRSSAGADYLIASFIDHIDGADGSRFAMLNRLVEGVVLASMVELGNYQPHMKLDRLEAVLDTPIVLAAIGVRGEDAKRSIQQALNLAKLLGAKVSVFEHTRTESAGVLEATANALRGQRRDFAGDVELYFRKNNLTAADAMVRAGAVEKDLTQLGVTIRETPDNYHRYGLDENLLETVLAETVRYSREQTRLRDVKSLSAIHRMRHGQSSGGFEQCKAVLVTDNSNVVRASGIAAKGDHDWPLAMSDSDLVYLLWLKRPDIGESISRQQLVAVAHAGMRPSQAMWTHYLEEIQKLELLGAVDPEEAMFLRTQPSAQDLLMAETAGTLAVSADVVGAVKRAIEQRIEEPLRQAVVKAGDAIADAEAAREDAVKRAEQEEAASTREKERASVAERARDEAVRELDDMRSAQEARVRKGVRRLVGAIRLVVALLLLVPLALYLLDAALPRWLPWAGSVSAALLLVVPYLLQAFGWMPTTLVGRMEEPLVRRRLARLSLPRTSEQPHARRAP